MNIPKVKTFLVATTTIVVLTVSHAHATSNCKTTMIETKQVQMEDRACKSNCENHKKKYSFQEISMNLNGLKAYPSTAYFLGATAKIECLGDKEKSCRLDGDKLVELASPYTKHRGRVLVGGWKNWGGPGIIKLSVKVCVPEDYRKKKK